jgi:hypothetical protein
LKLVGWRPEFGAWLYALLSRIGMHRLSKRKSRGGRRSEFRRKRAKLRNFLPTGTVDRNDWIAERFLRWSCPFICQFDPISRRSVHATGYYIGTYKLHYEVYYIARNRAKICRKIHEFSKRENPRKNISNLVRTYRYWLRCSVTRFNSYLLFLT